MKTVNVSDLNLILHGVVTRLTGKTGIVLFDGEERQSAYFNLADGCHVRLDESDQAVKFSGTIDIKRPQSYGDMGRRRIVVFLSRNPEWAWVWAYESEYQEIANTLAELNQQREREKDLEASKRIMRQVHIATMRKRLASLGMFRIAQAHKFTQESEMRLARPATGPMKLVDLLTSIGEGRIKFTRSEQRGNDTLLMWIEKQVGAAWVKVEMSLVEVVILLDFSEGKCGLETVQPILDQLASAGVAERELVMV